MASNARELLELQARTLFRHDERGRIVSVNEPNGGRAPLVFIARSAEDVIVRFRDDASAPVVDAAHSAIEALPPFDPDGDSGAAEALFRAIARVAPLARRRSGPAFVFPPFLFPAMGAMQIYPANAALLHPELATWAPELGDRRPCFAVVRERQAVAICASARRTREAAEAGVETVAAFRGQGCAGLAVAAWARAVRDSGRVPFYSTSWDNGASRHVASKLELELIGEDIEVA